MPFPDRKPKTYRQQVVWMEWMSDARLGGGGTFKPVPLQDHPDRAWTLYEHQDQLSVPTLPIKPVHHHGAFIEDYVHDWDYRQGKFHYYTRVMDVSCWVLLEYEVKTPTESPGATADTPAAP